MDGGLGVEPASFSFVRNDVFVTDEDIPHQQPFHSPPAIMYLLGNSLLLSLYHFKFMHRIRVFEVCAC